MPVWDRPGRTRFERFTHALSHVDALKWTTATYFLFLARPEKFMFVKPTVTQNAAGACGYEISYKSEPNWLTYPGCFRSPSI